MIERSKITQRFLSRRREVFHDPTPAPNLTAYSRLYFLTLTVRDLSFPPALSGGWTVLTTSGIRMDRRLRHSGVTAFPRLFLRSRFKARVYPRI